MRSALFVDFDNVYSGLRKMDAAIADRFARQPLEWVTWLGCGLALPDHLTAGARRRLLVRRCYLNPVLYQRFRPSLNRAGFEIAPLLARRSAENAMGLCRREQMVVDDAMSAAIIRWIGGDAKPAN